MRKLQVATTCPEWPAILLKQLEPLDSVTKEPRVGSIQEGIKCDVISLASVIEMRVTPVWVSANAVVQATRVGRAESCTESGSSQSLILHPRVNLWPMNSLGIFKWLGEKPENTLYHDRWNFFYQLQSSVSQILLELSHISSWLNHHKFQIFLRPGVLGNETQGWESPGWENLTKALPQRLGMKCFHVRFKRMQPDCLIRVLYCSRVKPEPCYWIWGIFGPWLILSTYNFIRYVALSNNFKNQMR